MEELISKIMQKKNCDAVVVKKDSDPKLWCIEAVKKDKDGKYVVVKKEK